MDRFMPQRQQTNPILLRDGKTSRLQRVPFSDPGFNEDWLQQLLFDNPSLLPIGDLEIAFSSAIPVARELSTSAGPIDLVLINEDGLLTVVETKLWRNPEARRKVIAQIVDYAKEMARWSYEELVAAVKVARPDVQQDDPLLALVSEHSDAFDESTFIDSVSRNLQRGRFLLLIVGDGIQEGVEHLTEFLQQTPQLGFTLGLAEIAIYRTGADDCELFIQPSILARTQEVVRAIVEIRSELPVEAVKVTLPDQKCETEKKTRQPISEELFFQELSEHAPDSTELARWVLDHVAEYGLSIKWGGAGPLVQYLDGESGEFFTFGQLNRNGNLESLWSLPYRCGVLALTDDIWKDYWHGLLPIIPGSQIVEFTNAKGQSYLELVYGETPRPSDKPPFGLLADRRDEWLALIGETVDNIRDELLAQ